MFRLKKLIWILIVLWIVFFIICDEKWIEIEWDKDHIVLHQTVKPKDSNIEKDENIIEPEKQSEISSNPEIYKDSDLIHVNYAFNNPIGLRESDGLNPNVSENQIVYKNSNSIKIYSWFENPIGLRESDGMAPEYLAKKDKEKAELEARNESLKYKTPNIVSVDDGKISEILGPVNNYDTLSIDDYITPTATVFLYKSENIEDDKWDDVWENIEEQNNNMVAWFVGFDPDDVDPWVIWDIEKILEENVEDEKNVGPENTHTDNKKAESEVTEIDTDKSEQNNSKDTENMKDKTNESNEQIQQVQEEIEINEEIEIKEKPEIKEVEDDSDQDISEETDTEILEVEEEIDNEVQIITAQAIDISAWIENIHSLTESFNEIINNILESKKQAPKIDKQDIYKLIKNHVVTLKKSEKIEHEFTIEDTEIDDSNNDTEIWLSDNMLEKLASNDEIDVNTLESENDEFLQEVFKKTNDPEVMNLIVETYLSEYQFVKAKKFIESLSPQQLDSLDPLLHLQVAFNSFSLTSKTTSSTLASLVDDYKVKNQISEEDNLWYLWVVSLMQKNYNHFFELANGFTSVEHRDFAAKLQWYQEQIAKQMWMPDYYFDTLVALELFNQWQFQPAKILALSSLQQNSNYILPYQVLAYANFLTNSRDTSLEYLKKLVDLDPNNAEKYRFLMWIAYYWDKQYQQSVVMLSLVKNQKLRLDAERYLIRDYVFLDQKNKLISIRNKLLWYDNLVASDFYTYFYEAFYHPFADWQPYQIYALDTELPNKMIRVCSMKLSEEEKAVCNYWMIGKNIALWQFEGLEYSLLQLATDYPQWYLYQALWEYYIQQWDTEKAKAYLLKAVSMTKRTAEVVQIKKLLQETM